MRYLRLLAIQLRASLAARDAVPRRLPARRRSSRSSGWRPPSCRSSSSSACARASPAGASARRSWSSAGSRSCRAVLEGAINPSLVDGGRPHPQGHARLRAPQARRRAVPRLDGALPAVAGVNVFTARGHLRLGLRPARARPVGGATWRVAAVAWWPPSCVLYSLWILDGERGLLRRAHRQPDAPLQRRLRRRALAGRASSAARRAARLHLRPPARADDDVPGPGPARDAAAATLAGALGGAALAFAVARVVWKASIARYTSAGG